MCNPRKITVTATESLSSEWAVEISRAADATGTAVGEARASENLRSVLGAPAYAAFTRRLGSSQAWIADDDGYRFETDGGEVYFDPETGEIEVVARLLEEVTGHGSADRRLSGTATGQSEASATGVWYTDGYAGLTETRVERETRLEAEQEARRVARIQADLGAEEAERRARSTLESDAENLTEQARAAAAADLEQQRSARVKELAADAADRLEGIRNTCMTEVNGLIGNAFRDAILEYARAHGARNILVDDSGDCIDIQFEF